MWATAWSWLGSFMCTAIGGGGRCSSRADSLRFEGRWGLRLAPFFRVVGWVGGLVHG